jgi:hypothetical protein
VTTAVEVSKRAMDEITSANIGALDLGCLLLSDVSTYAPDPEDEFLSDLSLGANEVDAAGYARVVVTGAAGTWDSGTSRWLYTVDAIVFDAIASGTGTMGYVVYVNDSDDDALSWIVQSGVGDTVSFDGGTVTVSLPSGLMRRGKT